MGVTKQNGRERQTAAHPTVAAGTGPQSKSTQTSRAFSTRRVTTHDLVFEIGRLSAISTTSPILYSPFSSWAWYLLDLATILPYSSCLVRRSIRTVTVLERLSLTTRPTRVRVFFDL